MMVRSNALLVLLLLAAGIVVAPAFGAQTDKAEKKGTKPAAADPVARAFTPPRGGTLTDEQTAAVEKVRSQYEQKLRDAMEAVRSAKDGKEKRETAAEVKRLREEIHREMASIFNTQSDNTPKTPQTKPAANHKTNNSGFRKAGARQMRTHGSRR